MSVHPLESSLPKKTLKSAVLQRLGLPRAGAGLGEASFARRWHWLSMEPPVEQVHPSPSQLLELLSLP